MKPEDFLLTDYELKVRYLTDHFQRMWTRFNFFVTIESALIGGKFIFGGGNFTWPLAFLGVVLSFIWYVFGAEDRFLVRVYRKQVEEAANKVTELVWPDKSMLTTLHCVGQIEGMADELRKDDAEKTILKRLVDRLSGWRFELISTTKLASLFPLFVFLVWLSVLI